MQYLDFIDFVRNANINFILVFIYSFGLFYVFSIRKKQYSLLTIFILISVLLFFSYTSSKGWFYRHVLIPHKVRVLYADMKENKQLPSLQKIAWLFSFSKKQEADYQIFLRLPQGLTIDQVSILQRLRGNRGEKMGRDFERIDVDKIRIDIPSECAVAKIVVYAFGYKVVMKEIIDFDFYDQFYGGRPWKPEFEKIEMVPVKLKLMDTDGNPVVGEKMCFHYAKPSLSDSIQYRDVCAVLSLFRPSFSSAVSDHQGIIETQLPLILDDPFFIQYSKSQFVHYDVFKFFLNPGCSEARSNFDDDYIYPQIDWERSIDEIFDIENMEVIKSEPTQIPALRNYPDIIDVKLWTVIINPVEG